MMMPLTLNTRKSAEVSKAYDVKRTMCPHDTQFVRMATTTGVAATPPRLRKVMAEDAAQGAQGAPPLAVGGPFCAVGIGRPPLAVGSLGDELVGRNPCGFDMLKRRALQGGRSKRRPYTRG